MTTVDISDSGDNDFDNEYLLNTVNNNKGYPALRVWELDPETSTRYDYIFAAPSDEVLTSYWYTWSILSLTSCVYSLFVLLCAVSSKHVRRNSFNAYLVYLLIPDVVFAFSCGITCLLNAIKGSYFSGWMCNFQQWYCVWGIGSNLWIIALVSHQIYKLLSSRTRVHTRTSDCTSASTRSTNTNKRKRYKYKCKYKYKIPSRIKVRNQALTVYLFTGLLGCLGFMDGPIFYSGPPSGLACLPVERDTLSTFFFYFLFMPLFGGIPIVYTLYTAFSIWKGGLVPKSNGKVRRAVYFFWSIIACFSVVWVPFMIIFVLSAYVPPKLHFVAGTLSHLQVFVMATAVMLKPDVWKAITQVIESIRYKVGCGKYKHDEEDGKDDDDDDSSVSSFGEKLEEYVQGKEEERSSIFFQLPFQLRPNSCDQQYRSVSTDWALPRPRKSKLCVDDSIWPEDDGVYRESTEFFYNNQKCTKSSQVSSYNNSNNDNALKENMDEFDSRTRRLISWNFQVFMDILQRIHSRRRSALMISTSNANDDNARCSVLENNYNNYNNNNDNNDNSNRLSFPPPGVTMPLEEVVETIFLPGFNSKIAQREQQEIDEDISEEEIPEDAAAQLRDFIISIVRLYNNSNFFHNFDHASHVVMSVTKLMSRIVAPINVENVNDDIMVDGDNTESNHDDQGNSSYLASDLSIYPDEYCSKQHQNNRRGKWQGSMWKSMNSKVLGMLEKNKKYQHDHTYGITSDPLTQFACAFSALIHDVDHSGVPNNRLIEENPEMAKIYKNRSVAEQNSFELSWNLLMEDRFYALRQVLFDGNFGELSRFRQIVINSVMATDLADKQLKELRNSRWERAFFNNAEEDDVESCRGGDCNAIDAIKDEPSDTARHNRKATIVIEHLIQTADVSHTMQHWRVYRKWNEKLFMEMYSAYKEGRSEQNPADSWYEGEFGFFDFYIIPLAKKMGDCGVFGSASQEYLHYARKNRREWEIQGEEVVRKMAAAAEKKYSDRKAKENVKKTKVLMPRGAVERQGLSGISRTEETKVMMPEGPVEKQGLLGICRTEETKTKTKTYIAPAYKKPTTQRRS